MKKVIEIILGLIGALCFCCICSEPCEGAPMSHWVIWELSWMAALVIDIKVITYCAKKGIIDADPDEMDEYDETYCTQCHGRCLDSNDKTCRHCGGSGIEPNRYEFKYRPFKIRKHENNEETYER